MSATDDSAAASPGETAEALFNQGLDHHDREAFDEAIRCYKRATELDPMMVVAHNNLGMVYIDKGLFEEAIVELTMTCALDEGYAEAYNNLGFVHRRAGDEVKAAAFYEKFLNLEPDIEDAPKMRAWLEQVRAKAGALPDVKELITGGQPDSAAAREVVTAGGPDEAASAEPSEPAATDETGTPDLLAAATEEARGQTESPYEEAAPAEGAEEEDIYNARTLMMQPGKVQAVLGGAGEGPPPKEPAPAEPPQPAAPPLPEAPRAPVAPAAPAAAPQKVRTEESPEAICERGLGQFEKGDIQGAEQTLRQAVAMNPRLAVARSTLGRVLAKSGRYDEAVAELRQAVDLDPTDAAGFYVLGFALRELGQNQAAAGDYEHYLELTPDAAEGAQIRAWIAEVHALPQVTPDELYDQAFGHYKEGQLDQALDECEQVLAVDEANAAASLLLGRILIDKDDLIRAVPALKRAEPLQPGNPEVHFYLGKAYDKRGLPEDAILAYQRCIEVNPAGPNAEWVRAWLEKAGGGEAAGAAVSRCEYCFRPFQPDQLSTHEGKKVCPDCTANLNIAPARGAGLPSLRPSAVDLAAAQEAAMIGRRRAKARAGRHALLVTLSVVAVLLLVLMVLMFGWLSGPFQRWGVHDALVAIGLGGPLRALGVDLPTRDMLVVGTPTDGEVGPVDVDDGKPPPVVEPLALSVAGLDGSKALHALPLVEFKAQARAAGAAGGYRFELLKSPDGMEIDGRSGAIRWVPRAPVLLVTDGDDGGRFQFPRRVPVEVRVTSGDESKTVEFEVAVNFAFEPGPVIDAGVRPGDTVRLAVGRLNVSDGRARDDIALAWGRYREGWLRVLYGVGDVGEDEGAEGRFSPGQPTDLGGAPSALVLADVTSDGRTDVVLANWSTGKLLVFRQNDKGVLSEAPSLPTARGVDFLAAGDFDGDGRVDIVASHWTEPKLYVYRQEEEAGAGRLSEPQVYPTERASGWNRVIVGPLAQAEGDGPKAVYLVSGSGGEPYFFMYGATPDGELEFYLTPTPTDILPKPPLEVMPVRLGEGPPHVAALVGGAEPVLYVIGARDDDLEVLFKQEIEGAPDPVGMTVVDLNGDSIDDIVVLCAEELHVLLGSETRGGPFVRAASVEIPLAVGPLVAGEFTHDGLPDVVVVLDDGKLQIVAAVHGAAGVTDKAHTDGGAE